MNTYVAPPHCKYDITSKSETPREGEQCEVDLQQPGSSSTLAPEILPGLP